MPGLEESISHDTSPPPTRALMSDGDHAVPEQVKRFVFRSRKTQGCAQADEEREESLEILIPEVRGNGDSPRYRGTTHTCRISGTPLVLRAACWLGRSCPRRGTIHRPSITYVSGFSRLVRFAFLSAPSLSVRRIFRRESVMNVIVLVYASDLINCWLLFNRYCLRKIVSLSFII